VPNPNNERPLRYDKNLDRPDIRPGVERILWNVKSLLDEAGRVDERYGIKADVLQGPEVSASRGINIFKESFDRFKSRIRKHQKETSAWNVTRWAIHDADKFEGVINRLEKFVNGLESITKSLGLLQEQRARLREEIESISDVESLRLLCGASSSHRSSQHDVSDTASRRLITLAESIAEQRTLTSTSIFLGTAHSFVTAETRPSTATKSQVSEEPPLPGAWPKSVKSDSNGQRLRGPPPKHQPRGAFKPSPSCEECLEEHYKCVTDTENESCTRCIQTSRACSFWRELKERTKEPVKAGPINQSTQVITFDSWTPPEGLPQNRRLLSGVIKKAKPRPPLSFAAGDAHYGERLATIKNQDENYWFNHSGKILGHANSSSSTAKRMFIDLRNIRAGKVPFVSAVPLDDRVDKVLASIEGPPETPYEGGIFWITVKLPENDPNAPPMMRFHTKVYHPNISPQGHICADYKEKWTSAFPAGIHRSPVKDPNALWYRAKSSDAEWTLGALLTALCGLLATPDVDDPLVPEIAQKYLEDFDGYCKNAKLYTQRFATGERPDESQLLFLEDLPANLSTMESFKTSQPISELDVDVVSLQRSLREKYDDKAPDALIYNPPRPISASLQCSQQAVQARPSPSAWPGREREGART
jgi:ubiquitin-protein ligase